MIILGIETSCDETSASVVKNGTKILSNIVASSSDIHAKTGGIIPENAARQQIKSIIPVIHQSLIEAYPKTKKHDLEKYADKIDAIAVTTGPGLIGSLLVGVETAKALSYIWEKPIIPVNHLPAHIYANWLSLKNENKILPELPAIALVVSGGHTDLVLLKNHGNIKWIGGTRDDAAGEAFDKIARLLDLPYPGGPSISNRSDDYLKNPAVKKGKLALFPRPMIGKDNFDFSFSGLKTSVLNYSVKNGVKKSEINRLAAEVQEAIVEVLAKKTISACKKYKPKSILLAGGVSANKRLREKFTEEIGLQRLNTKLFVPPPHLCTDNAAYIASYAYFHQNFIDWKSIAANPQLTITDS